MAGPTRARTALVTSASNTASSTTRGRLDLTSTNVDGGVLWAAVTNGGTGPTIQCTMRVLIAMKDSAMPSAASEGTADTDWKIVFEIGCGTTSSLKTRLPLWSFGPGVAYIEVEFTGNTGQAVTVEAHATTFVY